MKRNDIILIVTLLVLAMGAVGFFMLNKTSGGKVIVSIDGEEYKELDLNKDTTLVIEGKNGNTNTLVIKDGYAEMTEASCPDNLCIHQKAIHYNGELIVCLPNKVIVTVESEEEIRLDGVAE